MIPALLGLLAARRRGGVFEPPATSYANTGGTGDRTAIIAVTANWTPSAGTLDNLVDGSFAASSSGSIGRSVGVEVWLDGDYLQFDFGEPVYIDEAEAYGTGSQKQWIWMASNNGSDFVARSLQGEWTGDPKVWMLDQNNERYRYYRYLKVGAENGDNIWIPEFEFKIEDIL